MSDDAIPHKPEPGEDKEAAWRYVCMTCGQPIIEGNVYQTAGHRRDPDRLPPPSFDGSALCYANGHRWMKWRDANPQFGFERWTCEWCGKQIEVNIQPKGPDA